MESMADLDGATIRAAREGEPAGLARLFDATWASAWRLAYGICRDRTLAEDAAQEGLIRAIRSLDQFDERRGPFSPWLHTIIVRATLDLLRRERKATRGTASAPSPAEDLAGFDDIRDWLDALTPERRLLIVLRFWFDYKPTEIAAILDLPAGTVHSRLHRALSDLLPAAEVKYGKRN